MRDFHPAAVRDAMHRRPRDLITCSGVRIRPTVEEGFAHLDGCILTVVSGREASRVIVWKVKEGFEIAVADLTGDEEH